MRAWLKRLFCKHDWIRATYSANAYDWEAWDECTKCGKQK
jgi:hypothetical protein